MINHKIETAKRIGTGLAFILWPLVAAFAYAAHPNILSLEFGGDVIEVQGYLGEHWSDWFDNW